jgi:hypothetical protein
MKNCKLSQITLRINDILEKWHYTSEKVFLNDAREGKIEEAENDAISMTNLLDQRQELFENSGSRMGLKNQH